MLDWLYRRGYVLAERGALASEQFSPEQVSIFECVSEYTMTSPERIAVLVEAVDYISRLRINGAVVECGVWRGGSMMAIAMALLAREDLRDLYLFDTYEGLPAPSEHDVDLSGTRQMDLWPPERPAAVAGLAEVRAALATTGYEPAKLNFVPGRVEDTLPDRAPQSIALLRLDTDWYESTKHELEMLYPRLESSGVLLLDDYGHFHGAHAAADEYFADGGPFLIRTDYTARVAIKP